MEKRVNDEESERKKQEREREREGKRLSEIDKKSRCARSSQNISAFACNFRAVPRERRRGMDLRFD